MLLRELIVAVRLKTRKAEADATERQIKRIKGLMQGLAGLGLGGFSVFAVLRGVFNAVRAGSDVQETLNLMKETFRELTPEVIAWSERMGPALGRSRFLLQSFASNLQAMLVPMTQSREEAAMMSMQLSELAVDLASFFNTTEEDALVAIRAGLAGEVEPLRRRYGIVLTERAMAAFAKTTVNAVRRMSELERTQLRFRFIMAHSTDAQGDAIRTANAYANVLRSTKDRIEELYKIVGTELISSFTLLVGTFREIILNITEMAEKTSFVKSAFYTLAAAAAIAGVAMMVAFGGPLGMIAAFGAAVLALAVIVDEVRAFFDDSIEGYFENKFKEWGERAGEDFVGTFTTAIVEGLTEFFSRTIPGLSAIRSLSMSAGWGWDMGTMVKAAGAQREALASSPRDPWINRITGMRVVGGGGGGTTVNQQVNINAPITSEAVDPLGERMADTMYNSALYATPLGGQ